VFCATAASGWELFALTLKVAKKQASLDYNKDDNQKCGFG
jgi:hypothetical protein